MSRELEFQVLTITAVVSCSLKKLFVSTLNYYHKELTLSVYYHIFL